MQPTEVVLPPTPTRLPGRPRSKRIKGADEKETGKKENKCGSCGGFGHNSRSCKGGTVAAKKGSTSQPKKQRQATKQSGGGTQGTQQSCATQTQGPTTRAKGKTNVSVSGPSRKTGTSKNKVGKKVFKPPRQNSIP